MRITNTIFLFLLLSPSINLSAEENPLPTEDAKTQPLPASSSEQAGPESTVEKQPTGRELLQQNLEMARLAAEIESKKALYSTAPKRKFISASTQDVEYRAYMIDFVKKIEETGNANYPEEFKRKNIHGKVVITVSISRDGTVEEVSFNTFYTENPAIISALKDAILKTVAMSAPFAPLPETARKIDFLHITRTWEFGEGD